jgi:nanoRNase/pAp phosphatase (c-di-AMP/oligoRNAs hydrolase)
MDLDFIMLVNLISGTVELRTERDDIDTSIYAKYYGGGGHPKASGFTISKNEMNSIVRDIAEHFLSA